jgi:UDP-N-acetylglucosamine/UDP-N-acetylgalactosamine diphosphorylase
MKEPLQYHSTQELKKFRDQGIIMPDPGSVQIERSLNPEKFGKGSVFHPFSRIEGEGSFIGEGSEIGIAGPVSVFNSFVGRGSQVGTLGPVTLKDTFTGPNTVLGCGTSEETVFLGKETTVNDFTTGYGFRTLKGTLYEEDASSAQHTDTKMTLLLPWVTLGSNINFCDALVSGGTGPELGAFSEIGSGSIHFNFTPSGDKATASLFGNVVEGVFLNRERLFIGGNNSLLGPLEASFGASTAAGIRIHGKLPKGLHTGQALSRRVITRDFRILSGVRKTLSSQFNYLGELCAFINWYRQIRLGVIAQNAETRALYEAALRMLLLNYEERVKQIQHYFGLIEQSLVLIEQQKGQTREYENQQLILSCWPKLEEAFEINKTRDFPAPEDLTSELLKSVQTTNRDYTEMIRAMSPKSVSSGLSWMEECREKGGRTLSEILAP